MLNALRLFNGNGLLHTIARNESCSVVYGLWILKIKQLGHDRIGAQATNIACRSRNNCRCWVLDGRGQEELALALIGNELIRWLAAVPRSIDPLRIKLNRHSISTLSHRQLWCIGDIDRIMLTERTLHPVEHRCRFADGCLMEQRTWPGNLGHVPLTVVLIRNPGSTRISLGRIKSRIVSPKESDSSNALKHLLQPCFIVGSTSIPFGKLRGLLLRSSSPSDGNSLGVRYEVNVSIFTLVDDSVMASRLHCPDCHRLLREEVGWVSLEVQRVLEIEIRLENSSACIKRICPFRNITRNKHLINLRQRGWI